MTTFEYSPTNFKAGDILDVLQVDHTFAILTNGHFKNT